MRIGIPQGFIYYKHPGLWDGFFRELGFEVILSGKTNKDVLESGVKITESESCLPVKLFYGHIQYLIEKGVDVLLVPRYISLHKDRLGCPKFFALGDIIPAMFPKVPRILSPFVDLNKKPLSDSLVEAAMELGVSKIKAQAAAEKALEDYEEKKKLEEKKIEVALASGKPRVLLVSHPYNLYDDFVNANMVSGLKKLGVAPILIDWVKVKKENTQDCYFHWDFAHDMLNQIDEAFTLGINGGVQLSTFNCGCDSVLKEFVEKKFRESKIPFMPLILDEHTAEAGLVTRLEAFVDTLDKHE